MQQKQAQPKLKPSRVSKPRDKHSSKPLTAQDLRALVRIQSCTKFVLNLFIFIWFDVLLLVTIWSGLTWVVMLVLKQGKAICS